MGTKNLSDPCMLRYARPRRELCEVGQCIALMHNSELPLAPTVPVRVFRRSAIGDLLQLYDDDGGVGWRFSFLSI